MVMAGIDVSMAFSLVFGGIVICWVHEWNYSRDAKRNVQPKHKANNKHGLHKVS